MDRFALAAGLAKSCSMRIKGFTILSRNNELSSDGTASHKLQVYVSICLLKDQTGTKWEDSFNSLKSTGQVVTSTLQDDLDSFQKIFSLLFEEELTSGRPSPSLNGRFSCIQSSLLSC